jgi:hypothetical protein
MLLALARQILSPLPLLSPTLPRLAPFHPFHTLLLPSPLPIHHNAPLSFKLAAILSFPL